MQKGLQAQDQSSVLSEHSGRLPSQDAPGHWEQLPTFLHTQCPSPGRTGRASRPSQSPVRRPSKSSHISGAQRSRPFPNMDPAWCPNPLSEPAIRGRVWGTSGGVYGKNGAGPPGPPVVTVQCPPSVPHLWLGTPQANVRARGRRQASRTMRTWRPGWGWANFAQQNLSSPRPGFPAGPLWKRHRT